MGPYCPTGNGPTAFGPAGPGLLGLRPACLLVLVPYGPGFGPFGLGATGPCANLFGKKCGQYGPSSARAYGLRACWALLQLKLMLRLQLATT